MYNNIPSTGRCQNNKKASIHCRRNYIKPNLSLPPNTYADGLKGHMIETRFGTKWNGKEPFDTGNSKL